MSGAAGAGVLVAVDAGGTKTDAVALTLDGELVGHGRGGPANPQVSGLAESVATIDSAIRSALGEHSGDPHGVSRHAVSRANLYVAGLDLPLELERFGAAIAGHPWAAATVEYEVDLFAVLRSGTPAPDAAAVVCGTGTNALAIRSDGATARFPALGAISGDWGGGADLGREAMSAAARASDGRGPATSLTEAIPAALRMPDLRSVIEGLHFGELPWSVLPGLAPVLLAAARDGDAVAEAIVDRQAEEIVALAVSALTRVGLADAPVPVVLAGGLVRSGDARLLGGVRARLAERAPRAHLEIVTVAPIVGAGILALESAGVTAAALTRVRETLAHL